MKSKIIQKEKKRQEDNFEWEKAVNCEECSDNINKENEQWIKNE